MAEIDLLKRFFLKKLSNFGSIFKENVNFESFFENFVISKNVNGR